MTLHCTFIAQKKCNEKGRHQKFYRNLETSVYDFCDINDKIDNRRNNKACNKQPE